MALVNCGLIAYPPHDFGTAELSYGDHDARLDSAAARVTHTFMAPAGPPLEYLIVYFGTVNSAAPVRLRLETDSGGVPSGTLAWPGATAVIASPPHQSTTVNTLDSPGTLVPGQTYHVVISRDGDGAVDLYVARSRFEKTAMPVVLRSTDGGASWTPSRGTLAVSAHPAVELNLFGAGAFWAGEAIFQAASAVNEQGLHITSLPSKVRVVGVRARFYASPGAEVVARLYHPGGVAASAPLRGSYVSNDFNDGDTYFALSEAVELPRGADVRVAIHAASGGNVSLRTGYAGGSPAYGSIAGIPSTSRGHSGGAGAWTDDPERTCAVSLLIDRIDDGAGDGVYPDPGDVLDGVEYGPSADDLTGELEMPPAGDVRAGTSYGPDLATSGTLGLPSESDVRDGVHYGAGGTEFEGTLESGGGGGGMVFNPGMDGGFNG